MGWSVGWDHEHRRFRGYGVPAYCDAKGCAVEIDRGLGWACECHRCYDEDDSLTITTFVCGEHSCADVDWNDVPEHPDWIAHITTDSSWQQWRDEYPELVRAYLASEGPQTASDLTGG